MMQSKGLERSKAGPWLGMAGVMLLSLLIAQSAVFAADQKDEAGPFSQGRMRGTVFIGSGSVNNAGNTDTYLILGLGVGYYVLNGLEAGVDAESWQGGELDIYRVSAGVRYVFTTTHIMKPYVGAFYRHAYMDTLEDINSAGVRAGAYFVSDQNMYFGVGIVQEQYLNCNKNVYTSCNDTTVEVTLAFSF